jgi:hypothetical protein
MEMLIKQKSFNKQSLKKIFREFIEESRKNIDIKIKTISLILQSIKEENDQQILKSMTKIIILIKILSYL